MANITRPHQGLPYTTGGDGGGGIASVFDDPAPKLAANLNANGKRITALANPSGDGNDAVNLGTMQAAITQAISDLVDGAPTALDTLKELADALSDQTDALNALLTSVDGKVPTSRVVTAGTGLTGGGDLTTDRTLAVAYGTASGTAAQGNDTRLSDTRTPTDGTVTNAKIASGAAIALSKLATGYVAGTDKTGARTLTLWVGAEADYQAIVTKDANTVYFRTA